MGGGGGGNGLGRPSVNDERRGVEGPRAPSSALIPSREETVEDLSPVADCDGTSRRASGVRETR